MTNQYESSSLRSAKLLSAQTGTGAGSWFQLPRLKTIQIDGITTGTVILQGTNDLAAGTVHTLSTDTADNLRELNTPVLFIRANVTVATSVSVTVTAGFEKDV
jgi:hypothetical protein